ncbi:MAG TPA: PKD domain-containing protein, partial [Bacteroidia bacterium]|nr:PKD domain-containing protein [Bacteroidia bacterium]
MKVFRRLKPLLAIGIFLLCLQATSNAQCGGIDFIADKTDACHPTIIKFSAQGVPAGSTVTWDFGFGERPGKDTSQNVYTSPGNFTVVLKVLFSDGVTVCTVSKPNYIHIRPAPTPNFTVSQKVLCEGPQPVTITDVSTGTYTSRNWVVDGIIQSDSSQQIVYPFANTGFKEVMLVLKSAACPPVYYRVDSAVRIYNKLDFDFKTDISSGCLPAKITFTAENITAGHTINSYDWVFNGGSPAGSSLPQPIITYNNAGTYPVSLRLTNTDGCTHSVNRPDLVKIGDSSGFTITASKSKVCNNEIVTLSVSNPSLPGTFIWDLGPGESQQGSTPHQQRVKFNDTGFVSFKVTREYNGCKAVREYDDMVYVSPPIALFRVINSLDCEKNSELKIDNLSLRSPLETYTYDWRLYDASGAEVASSADEVPDFSTGNFGNYSIKLTITGSNGCSDERVEDDIKRAAGVAEINISTETSCINGPVTFFSDSKQFSNTEPNFYTWTIYGKDGVTVLKKHNSGILPRFTYRFNDTGAYNVLLEVNNSRCSASVLKAKYIRVIKPTTNFTISDIQPCVNTPVSLSASSSPSITPDYYYNWIFENSGDTSYKLRADSTTTASMIPDTPGIFNFYLLTNWANGTCTDTIKRLNHIKVSGVILNVGLSNYSGCDPMTVNATGAILVNHNYRNPSDKSIQYTWGASPASGVVFNSPNSQNSQVTFNLKGAFRVWLLSTNGSGCTDTSFAPREAYVGVTAGFKESTLAFCVGDTIEIEDQSKLSPDKWEYFSVPPGAVFLPSNNRPMPQIHFPDSGRYNILQVVSKGNGCFDTAVRTVVSIKVVADFASVDTLKYCAPAEVVFDNLSRNADSLTWYFGDGRSRTVPNADRVVYVYFKNSGRAGFDVKLVATNSLGCADSVVKIKFMTILGPVPDFTLDTTSGCSPLTVVITDSSQDYSQYYFDYGDGSPYDTTGSPPPHVYENIHPTDETVSYQPRLYMTDNQGCFAEYIYPATVDVHRYPEINFTADPDS